MIDLVSPITAIAEKIPSPLPASTLGTLPGFDAALPLADIVGGDPSLLFRHVEQLEHTGTLIDDVVSSSTGPILSAGADLFSIAQDFLTYAVTRAAALGNPLTAPAAAIDVSAEALRSVAEAEQRLLVLEQELAPFAAQLESLVADSEPMATPVSSAPVDSPVFQAASMSAPASVPALPAAEPGEAAPHDSVVTAPPNSEESSGANPAGQAAVAAAKSQLGTPYVWGGSQPGGFDCSGLTSWAYGQAGVEIPRTAENQAVGRQVSFDELQAGDLVVWDGHVAMYAEDGMMIEAGDPVQMNPVRTENIGMGFQGFWRPTG